MTGILEQLEVELITVLSLRSGAGMVVGYQFNNR